MSEQSTAEAVARVRSALGAISTREVESERRGLAALALIEQRLAELERVATEMLATAPGTSVTKLVNIAEALDEADFRHGDAWFGDPSADLMQDDLRRWSAALAASQPGESTEQAGER